MTRRASPRTGTWHPESASTAWQYASRMADGRVPCHFRHDRQGALVGPADERTLDPPMLVAQRDFEVEHLLPVALKAEVPGLDDPGMDRPDRDLVNLLASNPVVVHHPNNRPISFLPVPGIAARAIGGVKSHRLEPRVPFRHNTELLGDLPLEQMDFRTVRGERREPVSFKEASPDTQDRSNLIGEYCIETHAPAARFGVPEERGHAGTVAHAVLNLVEKVTDCQARNLGPRDSSRIPESREALHVVPSRVAAASRKRASSGGGM